MLRDASLFVLANLKDTEGGRGPDLPAEIAYQEVITPHRHARWRLYACSPASQLLGRGWPGVELLSDHLQTLLTRAQKHPTALPIARERLLRHFDGATLELVTRASFLNLVKVVVTESLKSPDVPFELDISPLSD